MNEKQKYELPVVSHHRPVIQRVEAGSIADELGVEAGDVLVSINQSPVQDIIDYYYLIDDEHLVLEIEKRDGELWELEIDKDLGEPIGIEFVDGILGEAKSCTNHCVFCFIDQLPAGMRSTLYFKDDDSRLSFLQGNFITLTNLSDSDIDRIVRYRISPINVSVHTTDPALRRRMLGNRFAGRLMERLGRFAEAGLTVHAQIVLCPGYNDGDELMRTLRDLESLHPSIASVSVVPVGLTRYRDGLAPLRLLTNEEAHATIDEVHRLQDEYLTRFGTRWVFLADELYIRAGRAFPDEDAYEGFVQYEDGIGMVRKLQGELLRAEHEYRTIGKDGQRAVLAVSGASVHPYLETSLAPYKEITVLRVDNRFFGPTITVSGLLTGQDIVAEIKRLGDRLDRYQQIWLPENMFRSGEDVLLDDWTLDSISQALGKPVFKIPCSGEGILNGIRRLYA